MCRSDAYRWFAWFTLNREKHEHREIEISRVAIEQIYLREETPTHLPNPYRSHQVPKDR